ncbi:MAG: hypothetical protein V5A16_02935 [Haloplanus sp.]
MAGSGAVVLAVLLLGIGGSLLLYWLVRAEHADRKVMDRSAAERDARRDVDDDRDRR